MSEIIARHLGRTAVAVLLLLWALPLQTAQAGWSYSGLWEVEEDNVGDMLQTYRQTVSASAGQDVTPIFSLEEYIRHGFYWKEQDTSRETVSPGMTAILHNELFALDLSASTLQTLSEASRLHDNELLELNLASQWQRDWWPNLIAMVGQSSTYDTLSAGTAGHSDRSESSLNGQLDWNLRRAFLYYNYRWSKFTDNTTNREDVLDSHLASLKASESFWGNRLRVSFNQEFTQDTYEHETGPSGGVFQQPVSRARIGTDLTPADLVDIADVDVPAIRDGLTGPIPAAVVAYNVAPPATFNNIWITVSGLQVNLIYIYTQTDLTPSLPVASNWTLFSNNAPSITPWLPVPIGPVNYDPLRQRYVIALSNPATVGELKVVFDNISATTMDITEIQVFRSVTGAGGTLLPDTELTTSRTRLNLDAVLSKTVKFKYSLALHNEEADQSYQRESMTNNATLEYLASDRTLRTVLTVGDNRSDVQGQGEVANTSYGVQVGKDFLPTLHGSLNVSRTEYLALGVDTLETDRFGLYLGAQLYPDLEASLEFEYGLATNLLTGTETETSQVDWDLTSRLKPNMSLSWTETFLTSETATSSEETLTSILHISWQPSAFLALSSVGRFDDLKDDPDKWRVTANMTMGIGLGMLLDVEYQHYYDQINVQSGRTSLRWTLSKYMYFRTGFDYIQRENLPDNHVKFFSELHVNFGVN